MADIGNSSTIERPFLFSGRSQSLFPRLQNQQDSNQVIVDRVEWSDPDELQNPPVYDEKTMARLENEDKKKKEPYKFVETKLPGEDRAKVVEQSKGAVENTVEAVKESRQRNTPLVNPLGDAPQVAERSGLFSRVRPSTPGVVDRVVGPWSMLTGSKDVVDGVNRVQNGDRVGGGLNILKGATSVTAGTVTTANVLTRTAPMTTLFSTTAAGSTAAASTLGKAVPVLGATASVVEGVSNVYDGVIEGDNEKIAVGTMKTLSGGIIMAGVVTGNPFLVAGGTVLYAGTALYEHRKVISNFFFGETPQTKLPTPQESTDVQVIDATTIEAKDQRMTVPMPTDYSSRKVRDGIMMDLGYSREDIQAFDKRYPKGFYISNNGGDNWASAEEMKTWKVNEYGATEIEMKGETIARLKAFYTERYPQ